MLCVYENAVSYPLYYCVYIYCGVGSLPHIPPRINMLCLYQYKNNTIEQLDGSLGRDSHSSLSFFPFIHTVKKEMNCIVGKPRYCTSRIIVHDTMRKSDSHELIPCSISVSLLHFFLSNGVQDSFLQ